MYGEILKIDTNTLSKNVINDIAYIYSAFGPVTGEKFNSFKKIIFSWDENLVKFIDKKAAEKVADFNEFVCPYDLLMNKVKIDITEFYRDIYYGYFDKLFIAYDDKAENIQKQIKEDFEKSMQTTLQKAENMLYLCIMQKSEAKEVIKKMQTLLSEREKALDKLIDSEYLQVIRYMVLCTYDDNCDTCSEMKGKTFLINDAEIRINCPPFHPNCNCSIGIMDEDSKIILLLDGKGEFIKNDETKNAVVEYLKRTLETFVSGDFSDAPPTLITTILNMLLGTDAHPAIAVADIITDVRDLIASVIKFDGSVESWVNLAINLIALIPLIGAAKSIAKSSDGFAAIVEGIIKSDLIDDAADAGKATIKGGLIDEAADVGKAAIKNSDEATDIAEGIVKGGLEDDIADTAKDTFKNSDDIADSGKDIAKNNSSDFRDSGEIRNEIIKNGLDTIDDVALKHSSVGDFTYNPKTGKVSKMKGGGHGQANLDFLDENGIEYNIVKEYENGVRVGNVPNHKVKAKRTGMNQSWFPSTWTESDIASAGEYVGNLPENINAADGITVFGEYNGVRIGVIRTNGKISTVFPDASLQP